MKNIIESIKSGEVSLEIDIYVGLGWRLSPKNTEERMQRDHTNLVLKKMGKDLEKTIEAKIIASIKTKGENP